MGFVDQHGLVRSKTLVASGLEPVFRNGLAFPSSLIAKDTAQRNVIPVFGGSAGFGVAGLGGVGDILLVPDPATFRVLPWAENTGWLIGDIFLRDGAPVPFSTRHVLGRATAALAAAGHRFVAGLEVEFHVFRLEQSSIPPASATWPPEPPEVSLFAHGTQFLSDTQGDQYEAVQTRLLAACRALDLPVRSFEMEMGPSQCEVTFGPAEALRAADNMVLFRSAVKQICQRMGLHATFMCRPAVANTMASGWHLHQSWVDAATGANAFAPAAEGDMLSRLGLHVVAGLLDQAAASCVFSTPTINGYKRFRGYSLAPDRAVWGRDNKGAMIRVVTAGPGDPAARLENRVGEPAANPYLYIASQIFCGLHGVQGALLPGAPSDAPYDAAAPLLPTSLMGALEALRGSAMYRTCLGDGVVDYLLAIKDAEVRRFLAEVTDWEQREYFSAF